MFNCKRTIIKSIAPLRQKPQQNGELIDELIFGMEVEVLQEEGEWLFILTSYNCRGYLSKNAVSALNLKEEGLEKVYIIASFADILSMPIYSAACLITLPRGASLALTGAKREKWQEAILPEDEKGWVREEAILRLQQGVGSKLRQNIVESALLYLGTQYRSGGKTPMGIDCSGLTSMTYLMNGIVIPRDSEAQMSFMKKVSRKESKPGDMLFFPGHAAIYIGEDKFIHADDNDATVRINSLNKDSRLYRKDLDEKYICTGTVF